MIALSGITQMNKIKLFLDGASVEQIKAAHSLSHIKGFTTNPTLMRKAGVTDYAAFAREAIEAAAGLPISFEVFSDDFDMMEKEARIIASWGDNVYVKIPVTNSRRQSSCPLVERLSGDGISLNVTALMTPEQVEQVADVLNPNANTIVSVFAGRVADTGVDPVPLMKECVDILGPNPRAELLWASPRELFNLFQAEQCGCHIITATQDVIAKLALVGKNLNDYSLETVTMFYNDACAARYKIA